MKEEQACCWIRKTEDTDRLYSIWKAVASSLCIRCAHFVLKRLEATELELRQFKRKERWRK